MHGAQLPLVYDVTHLITCAHSYEQRGSAYWHAFYKRNTDNFYKDRHYIHLVFPELAVDSPTRPHTQAPIHLLEVGSGVGNAGE